MNLVWSAKEVNQPKADSIPHRTGLKLLPMPGELKELPASEPATTQVRAKSPAHSGLIPLSPTATGMLGADERTSLP